MKKLTKKWLTNCLCQLLLSRTFIGEVQASYWDRASIDWCESKSVELL